MSPWQPLLIFKHREIKKKGTGPKSAITSYQKPFF